MKKRMAFLCSSGALSIAVVVSMQFVTVGNAAESQPFYAGKQINFLIGSAAGGGYGIYAEMLARHLGDHIPGRPKIVPQLMPGAGSLTAANVLYAQAPRDGTTIGAVFMGAIVEPLIGDRTKARYDSRKFEYIGSANRESSVCFARKGLHFTNWSDALHKPLIVAAAGWASSIRQFPAVLDKVLGTKFKVISGYPGSREAIEAVDKGEAQGICGIQWSSFSPAFGKWVTSGKVRVFGQISPPPGDAELNAMGVPNIWTIAKSSHDKQVLELIFDQMEFGRPYIAPPGVPRDRIAILQKAFDDTMKDPAFLADAKRSHLPINPMSGKQVQAAVAKLYAAPGNFVQEARQALN